MSSTKPYLTKLYFKNLTFLALTLPGGGGILTLAQPGATFPQPVTQILVAKLVISKVTKIWWKLFWDLAKVDLCPIFRNKTWPRRCEGLPFSYFSLVKKIIWKNRDWQVSLDQSWPRHSLGKLDRMRHEEQSGFLIHWNIRTWIGRQVSDSGFPKAFFALKENI